MKKKKLIPCIIAIVAIVLLGIAGVKLYQLMFGGAVKVQTADIISAGQSFSLPELLSLS